MLCFTLCCAFCPKITALWRLGCEGWVVRIGLWGLGCEGWAQREWGDVVHWNDTQHVVANAFQPKWHKITKVTLRSDAQAKRLGYQCLKFNQHQTFCNLPCPVSETDNNWISFLKINKVLLYWICHSLDHETKRCIVLTSIYLLRIHWRVDWQDVLWNKHQH